ncbi:MAG: aminomethyl-transferring glycine dehydrogenase, partial [Deltaproteobacteria bacterium]|nr:aminomethyl-transferring glycine dehydrogenase [Deltaproteobacteria bacterium]
MVQAAVKQGAEMKGQTGIQGIAQDSFVRRHIGPTESEVAEMLAMLGYKDLDSFIADAVPQQIRLKGSMQMSRFAHERSEADVIAMLSEMAAENKLYRSYIGTGYYGCITPPVIQRNILENPGWYTQYTPYQPEISQGRLEALLNFQTVVCDLTGLQIANASLLDEATAAAEAMTMSHALAAKNETGTANKYFVSRDCHPQTIAVVQTRAEALGIEIVISEFDKVSFDSSFFGALFQYPCTKGSIHDYRAVVEKVHAAGAFVTVAADILALALLTPPGEFGADIAVGSAQRFGVPMGFGGPHAAYFATRDEHKRLMPGRLVGLSKDTRGKPALRLALQTREQHIRREKATSNICTAQVLLAVMASMYAVYHGPEGIKRIANRVHALTKALADGISQLGFKVENHSFFDTIQVRTDGKTKDVLARAHAKKINLRVVDDAVLGISLDESVNEADVLQLLAVFGAEKAPHAIAVDGKSSAIPASLRRTSAFLTNPVFNRYHSETEFLRYIRRLESRDLSLATAMIPLGSCTMKLNATSEMLPVTWKEFGALHPFAPRDQFKGYEKMFQDLEVALQEITGFDAVSLQPNAGSQGEYAGLLAIRGYHRSRGDTNRTVCLIPKSAHGTNPASAVMA